MTLPFSINIHLEAADFAKIRRSGYISVECRSPPSPLTKCLGYCLHCKRVFSPSWTQKHLKRVRETIENTSKLFIVEKVELYRRDIITELQLQNERGRVDFGQSESRETGSHNRLNDCVQETMDVLERSEQTLSPDERCHEPHEQFLSQERS